MNAPTELPANIDTLVHELFDGWDLGAPPSSLKITVSTRLRVSLARCLPERPEIRLAAFLLEGQSSLLREVLCHEPAHLDGATQADLAIAFVTNSEYSRTTRVSV